MTIVMKAAFTVLKQSTFIAEPTELQKTFMWSNCLTLRHYYSYDQYHIG
jgi:hypothetical protein